MQNSIGQTDMNAITSEITCDRYKDNAWARSTVQVPREMALAIYVNLQELVTILCSPSKLNYLTYGFLYLEGIISTVGDVEAMSVCEEESLVDVRLRDSGYELPAARTLTSGCGGGATFQTQGEKVDSDFVTSPKTVLSLMKMLQKQIDLSRPGGGLHTAALASTENLLIVSDDIGRHNTLDKIQGECLLRALSTEDRLLISTGRISSEMLLKAGKMKVPIVVSRHSPTESAASLAHELGICLVGYARSNRMSVYSHPERLGC